MLNISDRICKESYLASSIVCEVYVVSAKEFVQVESCLSWYENSFMALAFSVADDNWLAVMACSVRV